MLLELGFHSSVQFDLFIRNMRVDIMLNMALDEILTSKRTNLSEQFFVRSSVDICLGRDACALLLKVLLQIAHFYVY